MLQMNDLYWLAGLLEGEGCFTITKMAPGGSIVISVGSADLDVIERIKKIMGGPNIIQRRKANPKATKPHYQFQVCSRTAVAWMMTLYTLLSVRRRARIMELLKWWKTRPANPNWKGPYTKQL